MKVIITNIGYINVFFIIGTLVFSCNSTKYALPERKISIAIDTIFTKQNINDSSQFLKINITNAYSKMVDSLSSLHGYEYHANYLLPKKIKSTFRLKGSYGIQNKKHYAGKYFVKGVFINQNNKKIYPGFAVYSNDSVKLYSGIDNLTLPEADQNKSLDHVVIISLSMGGILPSLVPEDHILKPNNKADSLKSFSINHYIYTKNKKDKKIAIILTNIMNNILVFNQNASNLYINRKKPKIRYNYYPNYYEKKNKIKNAQYDIDGKLFDLDNEYKLILSFTGPNLNLIAPSKIDTVILFSKNSILSSDYSDVMISLSKSVNTFTWQQIMKF